MNEAIEAKCQNNKCNKKKPCWEMFNYKIPIKWESGKIIFGAFNGIYFCDSACWLVYKEVVDSADKIKNLKCRREPTCDECLLQTGIHLPIIYNHKPPCQETYVGIIENQENKKIKRCVNCEVSSEINNCKNDLDLDSLSFWQKRKAIAKEKLKKKELNNNE